MPKDKTDLLKNTDLNVEPSIDFDTLKTERPTIQQAPKETTAKDSAQNSNAGGQPAKEPLAYLIGRNYPIIQINDIQLISDEVDYCEIEIKDLLPRLILKLSFKKTNFLKMNMPADGDVVSVFMRPMNDFYKPIHCDFVIKEVVTTAYKVRYEELYSVVIRGELFVPNIRRQGIQIAYPDSTSYDVLKKIAKTFKLGFSITDPEPMQDKMIWYQMGESTYDFIKNVTEHAWKNKDAFYDSWIDQYYNLTFSNQNKMLGITKEADGILDIANQVAITSRSVHDKFLDKHGGKSNMQEDNPIEVPRIFTNIYPAQYANQFIEAYSVDNRSTEISEQYGHVIDLTYNINNQGLFGSGATTVQHVVIEPAYNKDKIYDHVLLRGRTRDGYNNARTMQDFTKYNQDTIVNYVWGGNIQTRSEGDSTATAVGNSGNSYKEYVYAYYHNLLNNKELEKLTLNLEIKGLNTAVLKGEKVAVLNVEYSPTGALLNTPAASFGVGEQEYGVIDMFYSGWFIVTGLKFIYDKSLKYSGLDDQQEGLCYKTIVSVSRREWIPPENVSPVAFDKDGNMIRKDYGSTKYGQAPQGNTVNTGKSSSSSGASTAAVTPDKGLSSKYEGPQNQSEAEWPKTKVTPHEFIEKLLPYALEIERETGLSADYQLARAAMETGWNLSPKNNNFFGIKGKSAKGKSADFYTHEYLNGKNVGMTDTFALYDDVAESFEHHKNFVSKPNSRYSDAWNNYRTDPVAFAKAVNDAGYSTGQNATSLLVSVIGTVQRVRRDMQA